ncbi:hypothetical protein V495_04682 [Pseudogymnoascus sp. VKM F-4514 (FW-929)]|nr:hypothetical protein V495_04682 [Pseudogymnoascus sp. VKM F-4514 (FW-929)]KFY64987.1 hypothetical protein V497_01537 [Pseudogymnoascus sp. VKM F-4516 (FW-969)]
MIYYKRCHITAITLSLYIVSSLKYVRDQASPEVKTDKPREKIVRVDRIWDKKTRTFRYVKAVKPKKEKFGRYVITVARGISLQGVSDGNYLVEIRGKHVCKALSDIYENVDSISFTENKIELDTKELKILFHARDDLREQLKEAAASKISSEEEIFELSALLEFIQQHFSREFYELSELPAGQITFDLLWTLCSPHAMLLGSDDLGQDRVLRTEFVDSDGLNIGFIRSEYATIRIQQFQGTTALADLPAAPLHLHHSYETIKVDLISRGERILNLHGRRLQEYKGIALGPRDEEGNRIKFNSHGRVMLDPKIFAQVLPNNDHVPTIRNTLRRENVTDEHRLMMNPVVYGFSLGDKMWGSFAVAHLKAVDWDDQVINALVLPQDQKDFVRALVRTHGLSGIKAFDDFVRDKGKGLIGLLAGPPGVGKTLTAEAVAEIARRPLYTLSSGELGETSESVQKKLNEVLEITEAWGAVLLLDEADVFMAKRDDANLKRNAITSIFLRQIEYYHGIMLLTTNRMDSIDGAFQSRLHFCFEYTELSVASREKIFCSFIEKIKGTEGIVVDVSDEDVRELSKFPLNGRQIKNVMSISQAIALEKKEDLTVHIIHLAQKFTNTSIG